MTTIVRNKVIVHTPQALSALKTVLNYDHRQYLESWRSYTQLQAEYLSQLKTRQEAVFGLYNAALAEYFIRYPRRTKENRKFHPSVRNWAQVVIPQPPNTSVRIALDLYDGIFSEHRYSDKIIYKLIPLERPQWPDRTTYLFHLVAYKRLKRVTTPHVVISSKLASELSLTCQPISVI
jgi:hypothetical protein